MIFELGYEAWISIIQVRWVREEHFRSKFLSGMGNFFLLAQDMCLVLPLPAPSYFRESCGQLPHPLHFLAQICLPFLMRFILTTLPDLATCSLPPSWALQTCLILLYCPFSSHPSPPNANHLGTLDYLFIYGLFSAFSCQHISSVRSMSDDFCSPMSLSTMSGVWHSVRPQ